MSLAGWAGLAGMAAAAAFSWLALRKRMPGFEALAAAAAALAAWAWFSSLALSFGANLGVETLSAAWCLAAALAWIAAGPRPGKGMVRPAWPGWGWAMLAFPALTLLTALFAAPNNNDALSYHLPRAMHWIQQRSLAPFAAHNPLQLYFAPLAEVLQMQMLLLGGGDRLASLPQWLAYVLCGALAFGAARRLGGKDAAWMALLAVWSAPMLIAEASSAQNDLLCAAFCMAGLVLLWRAQREGDLGAAAWGGLASGLACLTKPTAYLFMAPWILTLLAMLLIPRVGAPRALKAAGLILLAGACFVAVQAPFWASNLRSGIPALGPSLGTSIEAPSPGLAAVSALEQAALHVPGFGGARESVARGLDKLLRALGLDPVDPRRTCCLEARRFELMPGTNDDVSAPNWAQLLLWLALGLGLAGCGAAARLSWLLPALGFLVFCALVKWQPAGARLHTPGFALASLGLGLGLARFGARDRAAAAILMAAAALPSLLMLEPRPLWGTHSVLSTPRWEQLFLNRGDLQTGVDAVLQKIKAAPCAKVALEDGGDSPEYLLWEGLRMEGRPFEIQCLKVANASRVYEDKNFRPCLRLGPGWKAE